MCEATKGKRQKRSTEKEKKGRRTSKTDRKGSYCRAINSVPSEMCVCSRARIPLVRLTGYRGQGEQMEVIPSEGKDTTKSMIMIARASY